MIVRRRDLPYLVSLLHIHAAGPLEGTVLGHELHEANEIRIHDPPVTTVVRMRNQQHIFFRDAGADASIGTTPC